ncbi:tape measure protein [Methylococcus mesophilus]|uniref:tape measure protein n=1 Tax=Methylococcus mesophilus TaxID=2993564 RepID=UPI00224AFE07|nr:tape measure protein [Methylococcus mesophilus]UZR29086.1 tape measure protein [Methylococcus mesophilus]
MATLKTVIEIAANTAAAEKGLGNVSAQVDRLVGSIKRVGHYTVGIFGTSEVLQAARDLGKLSDQYRNLEGRVKLAAGSQNQFTEAQRALFAIAQNNAQALTGVSQLYSRIAKGAGDMGVSQQQVLSVIDSVAKSFRISGASAEEASGATLQFSQALASGVLRGDEFNSIMEQSPRLAQAIADGLDVPIGKLRTMAEAGELTTQKVVDALQKVKASIDRDAAGLPDTIEQAVVRWDNAMMKYVGTSPAITHAADAIADAINGAAENIDAIATGVEVSGTLIASVLIGKASGAAAAFSGRILQTATDTAAATIAAREHALAEEAEARAMLASAEAAAVQARTLAAVAGAKQAAMLGVQSALPRAGLEAATAELTVAEQALASAQSRVVAAEAAVAASSTGILTRISTGISGIVRFLGGPLGVVAMLATASASWKLFGDSGESSLERIIKKRRELAKETGKDTRGKSETDLSLLQDEAAVKKQEAVVARLAARYKEVGQAADQAFMGGKIGRELAGETTLLQEMRAELAKRKQAAAESGDTVKAKEREVQQSFKDTQNALKDATAGLEDAYQRRTAAIDALEKLAETRIQAQSIEADAAPPIVYARNGVQATQARSELEQARQLHALTLQAEGARLKAVRDYAVQRLGLVDQVYTKEIAKFKDGEARKTALERESLQARRAIYSALESAYTATIDKLIGQEQRLLESARAAAQERRSIEQSTARAVAGIEQAALTPLQAARAQYAQLQQLLAQQRQELANGNLELSRQAGEQAAGLAESLGQQAAASLREQRLNALKGEQTPADPGQPQFSTEDLQRLIEARRQAGQALAEAAARQEQADTQAAAAVSQKIQETLQNLQSVQAEISDIDQQLTKGFALRVDVDPASLQTLQSQLAELLKPETKTITVVMNSQGEATGGDTALPGFRRGGWVRGYGGGDRIPALLEEGEFVLRKEAVRKFGLDKLYALNNLNIPRFSIGGYVAQAVPAFDASLARSSDGGTPVHIHLPGVPGSFALNGSQEVVQALKREVARAALKHGRIVR